MNRPFQKLYRASKLLFVATIFTICLASFTGSFQLNIALADTVDTQVDPIITEPGLGAEYRPLIVTAVSHIKGRRLVEAGAVLDQALKAFRERLSDSEAIYVSVPTSADLAAYKKQARPYGKIVWLDWSFGQALHLKAFVESAMRRFDSALRFLDEEITYAPTGAAPHIERGYILNQQKNSKGALEAYSLALDLSRRYTSSAGLEASALRGIGVVLIDLGDLDKAETYLQDSLRIEPSNPVAIHELQYIEQLRARRLVR